MYLIQYIVIHIYFLMEIVLIDYNIKYASLMQG